MKLPNFKIEMSRQDGLIIRDLGPWDQYPTITNSAKELVTHLANHNALPPGRQLLYYDSDGNVDEICHDGNGNFTGFRFITPQQERKINQS